MTIFGAVIALCIFSITSAKEKCCDELIGCFTDDYPFDSFPLPQCLERLDPTMTMFTRQNPDQGEIISRDTIPSLWSPGRRTVILTHGFLQGGDVYWLRDMRNAFLQHYDYNVLILGWGKFSINYWQMASNTQVLGAELGNVINNLINSGGASAKDFWCVGHSLGAHLCGHIGNRKLKIGRITGLDPAGPWFEDKLPSKLGLNKDTADFVDAWHTHGEASLVLGTGTLKPLGHADFYPNGGGTQPGCIIDSWHPDWLLLNQTSPDNTLDSSNDQGESPEGFVDLTPACSHIRAVLYFIESIEPSCKFYTRHICWDAYNIPDACIPCGPNNAPCNEMSPATEDYGLPEGYLYLTTNKEDPFCQG